MKVKKPLTNQHKTMYNGNVILRHCGKVQAFEYEGSIFIQCKECRQWIKIEKTTKDQ